MSDDGFWCVSIAATNPGGREAWASLTYRKHVSSRSPNIKLIVRPFSIPYLYLKPIVIAFFFSFLGLLGNKPFSSHRHTTQLAVWAFCTAFPLFFVRIANLCVVRTRRVGSYKYRSKMQAIIMFRIRAAQQGSNTYRNLPV